MQQHTNEEMAGNKGEEEQNRPDFPGVLTAEEIASLKAGINFSKPSYDNNDSYGDDGIDLIENAEPGKYLADFEAILLQLNLKKPDKPKAWKSLREERAEAQLEEEMRIKEKEEREERDPFGEIREFMAFLDNPEAPRKYNGKVFYYYDKYAVEIVEDAKTGKLSYIAINGYLEQTVLGAEKIEKLFRGLGRYLDQKARGAER